MSAAAKARKHRRRGARLERATKCRLLNDLLNLPPCTAIELVDPLPPGLPVRCADDAAQQALANSPDVREAEQGIVKAEAALKVARMAYVPDVNVIGGCADQHFADYIQHGFSFVGVTAKAELEQMKAEIAYRVAHAKLAGLLGQP
jgi:outer membrane protein TolC